MADQKMPRMVLPTSPTAPIAKTAISAMSRPYSMRSCPCSLRRRRLMIENVSCMELLVECRGYRYADGRRRQLGKCGCQAGPGTRGRRCNVLRCAAERAGDRREDAVHRTAGRADSGDRDERDQRDEQRVLEQILAFFVAGNGLDECDELSHESSRWFTPLGGAMLRRVAAVRLCERTRRPVEHGPTDRNGCATDAKTHRRTTRNSFCTLLFAAVPVTRFEPTPRTAAHRCNQSIP